MKIVSLNCPNCGANFRMEVNANRKTCFCGACGTQIHLDDEVKRTEYKTVSENTADVKNVELKRIKYETACKQYEKEMEMYYSNGKMRLIISGLIVAPIPISFIVALIVYFTTYNGDLAAVIGMGIPACVVLFGGVALMLIWEKPKPPEFE